MNVLGRFFFNSRKDRQKDGVFFEIYVEELTFLIILNIEKFGFSLQGEFTGLKWQDIGILHVKIWSIVLNKGEHRILGGEGGEIT